MFIRPIGKHKKKNLIEKVVYHLLTPSKNPIHVKTKVPYKLKRKAWGTFDI